MKKQKRATDAKVASRSRLGTVKTSMYLDRDLWHRVRVLAAQQDVPAVELLHLALRKLLKPREPYELARLRAAGKTAELVRLRAAGKTGEVARIRAERQRKLARLRAAAASKKVAR